MSNPTIRPRLLGCLLTLALVACGTDGWTPYLSAGGRFRVDAPAEPVVNSTVVPTQAGPLDTFRVSFTPDDTVTYAVVYSDFPAEVIERSTPAQLLDGARSGLLQRVKGRLLREDPIELDRFPGRSLEVAVPGGMTLTNDLYIVEGRMYQVMVITTPEKTGSPEVRRFLDSFRLIGDR